MQLKESVSRKWAYGVCAFCVLRKWFRGEPSVIMLMISPSRTCSNEVCPPRLPFLLPARFQQQDRRRQIYVGFCCYIDIKILGVPPPRTGHAFPKQRHMRRGGYLFLPGFSSLVWCHPWMDDGTDGWMDGWKASRKTTTTSFTICNRRWTSHAQMLHFLVLHAQGHWLMNYYFHPIIVNITYNELFNSPYFTSSIF